MANTLKFGNGQWATKYESTLAYNDENGNYKPLPFTFERRGNATRVNKEGLIEVVGENIPRIDYLNDSNGALLLEPSRTNIVRYSEDGTQWDTINSTVSLTTDSTSPSGQSSVYKVNDDATDAQHRIDVRPSVTSGTEYVFSAFVKKPSGSDIDFAYLIFGSKFSTTRFYFNIEEGTSLDSGGTIEDYGNGWYRLSAKATTNSSGNGLFGVNLTNAYNNNTYSGTGNGSMFVWGIQVESNASYPTSYIPTQGSAVTRLADSCNNGGNEQVINSTEGVLYAEVSALANDGTFRQISISDGNTSNRVTIYYTSTNNQIGWNVIVGGSVQAFSTPTISEAKSLNKFALKYKENDFSFWINGTKVATDTSGNTFSNGTLTELAFDRGDGGDDFYGNVKDVRVYDTALTDQELAALTQV